MRGIKVILAGALVAGSTLGGGSGSAAPAVDGKSATVTLAGKTVVTGSHAGVVNVRIPTPAVWSGKASDVNITGGGELPGFLLTREKKYTYDHPVLGRLESTTDEVVLSGTKLPKRGVTKKFSSGQRTLVMMPWEQVLKPGDYKLYLVADGAPVKVTINLKGLLGTTRISPTSRTGIDMKQLPERTKVSAPGQGLFTAGDDAKLEKPGLVFDAMVVEVKDSPEGEIGSCVYRGEPADEEQGEAISYGPKCIGAMPGRDYYSTEIHYTTNFIDGRYKAMYGYVSTLEADTWTVSDWFRGTGTLGRGAAYGYWLNFK